MEKTLIAIQDYQKFLGTPNIPSQEFDGFRNAYHPWGNGWNCRMVTDAGLQWLKANGIRYAEYTVRPHDPLSHPPRHPALGPRAWRCARLVAVMSWGNTSCACKVPDAMDCARRKHYITDEIGGEVTPFDETDPDNACECFCHDGDPIDEDVK